MNRMKELREERQITMKEAAQRLGLPYTTYVNYEKCLREPNSEMLIQIANFYNCSIDYLVGKSSDRIDEALLDAVNESDQFLLMLVRNPVEAQEIYNLAVEEHQFDAAKQRLYRIIGADVVKTLQEMNFTISDTTPQLDQIIANARKLNADGQQQLADYSDFLVASGKYEKTPLDREKIKQLRQENKDESQKED